MPTYTAPKTWQRGYGVTYEDFNLYVRDNLEYLSEPPLCRIYHDANQSIPNATETTLDFNTDRYDTDTMHSTVTNTERITFTRAGIYHITANVTFASNAVGRRYIALRLNASASALVYEIAEAVNGSAQGLCLSFVYAFSAADYLEVRAYQNSGGALNVVATGNYSPEFSAVFLRD